MGLFHAQPPRGRLALLHVGGASLGAVGLLPTGAGEVDPLGLLAWLTLIAPGVGGLLGARGARLWPFAWAVPGFWFFLLVWAGLGGERVIPQPLWAASVVVGFYAIGFGVGAFVGRGAWGLAGGLVLAMVVLSGICVQFGWGSTSWGRTHPRLARVLIELSPLVVAAECAGWDWTHSQPDVYRVSGVEWFPRRAYRGSLAGPVVLVVGCSIAIVASRRKRRPSEERSIPEEALL